MPLQRNPQGVGDRQRREEAGLLERAAQALHRPSVGGAPSDVDAVQEDAAAVGRLEPTHEVEQRGLAGSVVTDDPDDAAGVDGPTVIAAELEAWW